MADLVLESPRNPHFLQPLLHGFVNFLNIPVKFFSVHIEGRYEGQTVDLRSDVSDKSWKVKIEGRRLTIGWKEFVTAHDLRIGDVIIFKQQRAFVFHVTDFGRHFCEVRYAQQCCNEDDEDSLENDQVNMGKLSRKKHVKKKVPKAEAKSYSSDQSCFVAQVTKSNLHEDTLFLPRKVDSLNKGPNNIVLVNEEARTWTLSLKFRESTRTFYMRAGWRNFCRENGLKLGDFVTFKLESNKTKTPLLRFTIAKSVSVLTKDRIKGKRQKTGGNNQRVSSSSFSQHENRFLTLTVTPASLKYCRLNIPKNFIRANGMGNVGRKKITLLDKHGVEWPVHLLMEKNNKSIRLGSGLKEFFQANGIKVYQSFVLELVWEEKTTFPMFKFCFKTNT